MRSAVTTCAVTVILHAGAALGQTAEPAPVLDPFRFGVGGGASHYRTEDAGTTGGHAQASAITTIRALGLLARGDLGYASLPHQDCPAGAGDDAASCRAVAALRDVLWATASVGYARQLGLLRTYAVGGVGGYWRAIRDRGQRERVGDVGINAGGGIERPLRGVTLFLEGRVHGILTAGDPSYLFPVTLGLTF
jgi:hypothetical protein